MGFTVQFLLGTVLVLLCCLSIQSTQDAEKTTEKIKIEEVTSNIENLTTNKPKTENSTETKQQNSVGLNLEKNEEEPKEIGRSIDIEKYVSKEFHNKNNVYTLPTSPDTEKYIDHEYDFHETTQKHHEEFNYETELTTPKSSIFDQKYQQAVESVDQKLEHIDDSHEISAEIEPKESIDVEKLYEETKKNDTKADLNFVNFKNFQTNDTGSKNSLHKNVVLESGTNLNFQRSYNHTTVENESGNNTIVKEPEKKIETTTLSNVIKSELEKAESSTIKTTLTTRKSLVLTKPPNRNSSHISILSNNIETETVKAINPTTESTWKSPTDITRRGSVKYAHTLTTEPTGITNNINKKSEQLLQENQVIPVHVEAPPSAQNVTTTIPVKISTTTSYVTHSTETATTATTIQVKDITTTPEIPTTIQVKIGTTTAEIPTKIQANISTTTAEIPTTKIQAKIGSTTAEIPTTKIQANISTTTAEIPTTKLQAKIGTTVETPTTKVQAKIGTTVETPTPTTKMQAKISTTTPDISTTMQEETTTELQSTTTPETETRITYSVEARIKTVSVATQTTPQTETTTETTTTEVQTTFLADSTAATTEMPETTTETVNTSENIVRTSKGMNFGENFPTIPDTTTEMQTTEMTTTEKVPAVNVIPKMGPVVTTVEPEVETTTFDRTDLVPEFKTAGPETTEAETTENHTITSDSYELTTDPPSDNSGTIAAIAISSVAAICLIGVAILLVIMRKRQKRFNYGQRCRPVNLDDYSMDNVSVYNSVRRKGLLRGSKRSYGNPAFEDPVSVSHPLNFPALGKFANNFEDIKAEFEEIPQITARTNELPEGCETKNRYANVIPLPETRVLLNLIEGYPNSDYINANYVTGPKNTKGYYIACQAPMQNTVDDFWRMIWEQQCKVVLMLTHLFENGVEKCVDYLPPSEVLDCHRLFGDFQVTLKKREVKDKYIISSLQLKNMVSNSWREVTHFWYLGWPEKGVPSEANSLIAFLIEARSYMKSSSIDRKEVTNGNLMNGAAKNEVNPVVVHCSPGTGRTGVVIACDIAIREFEQTRLVDVPKIVYKIRRDRASAVQTKEQYTFIYKVINLYATKLTGGALDSL